MTDDQTVAVAEMSAGGVDAVLSDNARRLRSIVGRWRHEDGDRPTALPIVRSAEATVSQSAPAASPLTTERSAPVAPMSNPAPLAAAVVGAPGDGPGGDPGDGQAAAELVPIISAPTAPPQNDTQPDLVAAAADVRAVADTGAAEPSATPTAAIPVEPVVPVRRRAATAPVAERLLDPGARVAEKSHEAAPTSKTAKQNTTQPEPMAIAPPEPLARPPVHALSKKGELWLALLASKRALTAVGWFSCVINILMLAGPLFMLQVYDRVMSSGSMPTLVALLALTTVVYAIIGVLELVRSRIITRIGIEIDQRIGDRIFEASLKWSVSNSGSPSAALRDLDTLRTFVAGPAPMTFFDVWWAPIYLLVIFATHWTLGLAALAGCAMLLFTAWLSDSRSRAPLTESQKSAVRGMEMAETGQRNAEAIAAMGMVGAYRQRWQKLNQEALAWQVYASDILGGVSAASKTLRLLLQSVMLAIGAALALKGEISSGSIIAATIIFGRALAPVEQVITHWRGSLKAFDAYKKLEALLAAVPARPRSVALPTPTGRIDVDGLKVAAPNGRQLILNGVSFAVRPGQMLAVIGPSASGKSSLTRALVGLWRPAGGSIRLDGVDISQWDSEALGKHIGYLPQDMELFSGSVRENIGRFRNDVTDQDVIAAATAAHAHELIMSLPNGYATELGAFGTHLSGGQRQRIALARALFGNPALVVLDEANANLDREGDVALSAAIDGMRQRGQAIIFVSHRVQAIQQADTLLYLDRGVQKAFGPRAEVLKAISGQGSAKPTAPAAAAAATDQKPKAAGASFAAAVAS